MNDNNVRPQTLDSYVGQDELKQNLKVFIDSARKRNVPLDHCLFYGPPGLGKTTLANLIANELGVKFVSTTAPTLQTPGDITNILTNLEDKSVLFIDEIHSLPRELEEVLYPAMEDFKLSLKTGRTLINLKINRFTLIGATTRLDLISAPLLSRCAITRYFRYYTDEELAKVITDASVKLKMNIETRGLVEIVIRSRGTPRTVINLLKRVYDFGVAKGEDPVKTETVKEALVALKIDNKGLNEVDRKLLNTIIDKFGGGPVGLKTIAAAINEPADAVAGIYEPYLIQKGFIVLTPQGRKVTELARQHLEEVKSLWK